MRRCSNTGRSRVRTPDTFRRIPEEGTPTIMVYRSGTHRVAALRLPITGR